MFPEHQGRWELPHHPALHVSLTFLPILYYLPPLTRPDSIQDPTCSHLQTFAHNTLPPRSALSTSSLTEHLLSLQGSAQPPDSVTVVSVGFPESHYLQFEETLRAG